MTEKEYRQHPAISRSELWHIRESPEKFKWYREIQFLISGHFQPWDGAGMRLWYRCACYECGAEMNSGMATTMKEATKEWNRRKA